MSGAQGGKLSNVLSISTAANNRYLLHFNSLNSLTQWTAGIRLAMFEHSTLQEAYTGSLIAGKGKMLNNVKAIMERARFPHEDWARVRFGAGTPWRRLWFVVTPPDEKEYQKAQKMQKKGATYLRSQLPRGDIKFYESRKVTKKSKPIATINDVYAAYAIYPQSMPLIEQSTLVKMEGQVTIHSSPETTAEGFVFIMPEVHPAVSGFEMMLRWLFPVWDTFNLYGRPTRLIADTLDQRGLMFAMPRDRRYGYLDILDVSGLIHETGSQTWTERQWRKQMKKLTAERMNTQLENGYGGRTSMSPRRSMGANRSSLPPTSRQGVRFDDGTSSVPQSRAESPVQSPDSAGAFAPPRRVGTAPPSQWSPHKRAASDAQGYKRYQTDVPSRLSQESGRPEEYAPPPPRHGAPFVNSPQSYSPGPGQLQRIESGVVTPTLTSLKAGLHETTDPVEVPPAPVVTPPAFTHSPSSRPAVQPAIAPELRRAHSGVDAATLHQMREAATVERTPDDDYINLPTNMVNMPGASQNLERSNTDQFQGTTNADTILKNRTRQPLPVIQASPRQPEEFQALSQPAIVQPEPVRQPHPLPQLPTSNMTAASAGPQTTALPLLEQTGMQSQARPPMPPPVKSSQSISRKPVPRRTTDSSTNGPASTSTPSGSEHGSLLGSYVDNEALERILSDDARLNSMGSIASSATPDYASTVSTKSPPKHSIEKPRMGKLKTVGDPDAKPPTSKFDTYYADQEAEKAEIPNVDFGPTYSYKPNSRPGTGATARPGDRSRSQSGDRLGDTSRNRLSALIGFGQRNSPGASNRRSYFGRSTTQDEQLNDTNNNSKRNSIAWMPSASGNPVKQDGMTAEQWVQHRAAIASQPQLAPRGSMPMLSHSRESSTSTVTQARKLTKTPPPFARASSGDWSNLGRQTPPSRPDSRGAGTYFGQPSPGRSIPTTPPATLSAKEQMYIARATGTPLMNAVPGSSQLQENTPPGLLGSITAREQEKAAIKDGMRNGMVEEAIRARQQQQAQLDADALRHQTFLAQQQQQQHLQAQKFQQSAYARSVMSQNPAAPVTHQDQPKRQSWRQSWFQSAPQQQYQQQWQPVQQTARGYGMMGPTTPGTEVSHSSPFAQRLYEGQQQQAFAGQQSVARPTADGKNLGQSSQQGSGYFNGR